MKECTVKTDQPETITHTGTTQKPNETSLKELTVLIVDDEISVLKALRRTLADENYRILTTDSSKQAIELLTNVLK